MGGRMSASEHKPQGTEILGGDAGKPAMANLLRRGLVQNILALYGAHFGSYLLPLVTVPYLTRVLGPAQWGMVAIAQSFAGYMGIITDYGFELSATREVSQQRDFPEKLAELLASVNCAKALLAVVAVAAALLCKELIPALSGNSLLFWMAIFEALARAFSPSWYYVGRERMRQVAFAEILARTLATVGILLVVRSPDDGWKVPALYGLAWLGFSAVMLGWAYVGVPLRLPRPGPTLAMLRRGWGIFLTYLGSSSYTAGNAFILGLFAPPEIVAYFAGPERIVRTLVGLFAPIVRTLYPMLSQLVPSSPREARRIVRIAVCVMAAFGLALALLLFIPAGFWVRTLLGRQFAPATPVLMILAWMLPLVAVAVVLGQLWMLPKGMDYSLMGIIYAGAGVNVLLAVLLAPRYNHIGMACSVVATEFFVTSAIYLLLRLRHLDPLTEERRV